MDHKTINVALRCIWMGLLAGSVLFLASCRPETRVHAADRPARKSDPLLGKWIMIGDNGGGGNGTIADFRPDGTVVFKQKGKRITTRYRREPGKTWVDRRTRG